MGDREHAKPGAEPAPGENGEETFLSRWSRLKAQNKTATPEPPPADDAPADAPLVEATASPPAEADAEPPGDEDMPPLESLTEDSDFSGFMSPRVSAVLRKQALRKLFRSQKFNVISELDDYIDDYRNYPALGDIVTSDMKHAAARLLKKQLEAAEAAAAEEGAAEPVAASTAAASADEAAAPASAEPHAGESADAEPRDTKYAVEPGDAEDSTTDTNNDQEQPPRDA